MTDRQLISTGTIWEEQVGYSRAVRVGNQIFVTGTIAADKGGNVLHPDDPYAQAAAAIHKIEGALREAGGSLEDVVRTRAFITSLEDAAEIGRAHHDAFNSIKPCCTMVQIAGLFANARLEIEVDAILGE